MSVLATLKKAGGSAGGVAIYDAAKAAALLTNIPRKRRKLKDSTKKLMKKYFPQLKLGKVRYSINANLPANWFEHPNKVDAMTFGHWIVFKGSRIQGTKRGLSLLMHELVHVDQVRRFGGEHAFASRYGQGYLKGGSYRNNPLEVEAYDFVAKHPLP